MYNSIFFVFPPPPSSYTSSESHVAWRLIPFSVEGMVAVSMVRMLLPMLPMLMMMMMWGGSEKESLLSTQTDQE